MMLDRMEGNAELKTSVQQMLATRRLTHSIFYICNYSELFQVVLNSCLMFINVN